MTENVESFNKERCVKWSKEIGQSSSGTLEQGYSIGGPRENVAREDLASGPPNIFNILIEVGRKKKLSLKKIKHGF